MKRSSARNASDRVALTAARFTIESANDKPMMQEVQAKFLHEEEADTIEHFHPYGFTAVPKKPDGDKKAEGVAVFVNGSRSHPLVIVVGDRRYRLKDGQEGEVAIHDDQGQKVHLTRAGIVIDGGGSKLPITIQTGDGSVKVEKDTITAKVKDMTVVITKDKVCLGSAGASDPVMLVSGPSSKIFGVA
jgi:phage gp45-like